MPVIDWRVLVLASCACGSGDGQGVIAVSAYGEEFVEQGIPASAVDDGWAIEFDSFRVQLRDIRVAGQAMAAPPEVDLAADSMGAGHELGAVSVAAGAYADASFVIERLSVAGSALKGAELSTFDLVFEEATAYERCEARTIVTEGSISPFQITVHADHLFYDSLVSARPRVVFQAIADADADRDGSVERAELAAADIGAYDPGSEGGAGDLWAWLVAASRSVGHVDGEGHCEVSPLRNGE